MFKGLLSAAPAWGSILGVGPELSRTVGAGPIACPGRGRRAPPLSPNILSTLWARRSTAVDRRSQPMNASLRVRLLALGLATLIVACESPRVVSPPNVATTERHDNSHGARPSIVSSLTKRARWSTVHSAGDEPQRQARDAAEHDARMERQRRVVRALERACTVEERAERDLRLEAREIRAEAVVRPEAEREMLVVAPADVEAVRIRKDVGVAVRGAEPADDHPVRRDVDASHRDGARRPARVQLHG